MSRFKNATVRSIKIAVIGICIFGIRGSYDAYENRHLKVIHSNYMLNAVHPLVRERYLELRNVFYSNRHSKDDLVKALLRKGALIDLDISSLKKNGYGGSFDHQVPKVNGVQLSMPDEGAVVIRLTNWDTTNWKAELNLALPFARGADLKEFLALQTLGRLPF